MSYAYVLIYSNALGTRQEVKDYLDNIPEILDWRYDMPNAFYIVSDEPDADVLAAKLMEQAPEGASFLLLGYTDNSQGLLSKETWSLLNNKRRRSSLRRR